jgi:hypothetical protein
MIAVRARWCPRFMCSVSAASGEDAVLDGVERRCAPRRNSDLRVHVLDVVVGGLGRDREIVGDLASR